MVPVTLIIQVLLRVQSTCSLNSLANSSPPKMVLIMINRKCARSPHQSTTQSNRVMQMGDLCHARTCAMNKVGLSGGNAKQLPQTCRSACLMWPREIHSISQNCDERSRMRTQWDNSTTATLLVTKSLLIKFPRTFMCNYRVFCILF